MLTLHKSLSKELDTLEAEIHKLIEEVHPHYLSIPGIGSISAAVIYALEKQEVDFNAQKLR